MLPNNTPVSQAAIIHQYNDQHREKFNDALFQRSDEDIINAMKEVILSCQRSKHAVIRVIDFEVISDYKIVRDILRQHENQRIKNPQKVINTFNYIDLKDSDIYLLKVNYFIKAKDGEMILPVYIALPRIMNKYYFHIYGNDYYAMYQIVDNSTYNNSMAASSKRQTVTLKTIFMPIRIYREVVTLMQTNNEAVKTVYYASVIFGKKLPAIKYILGKLGYKDALYFMGYGDIVTIVDHNTPRGENDNEIYYFFRTPSKRIVIKVPKVIFDGDHVLQSLIYTVTQSIYVDTSPFDIYNNEFWLVSLGGDFKNFSTKKGEAILDSFESLYDTPTYNDLKLPHEKKQSIYHILLWMLREFTRLRLKDNLNISFKKIRIAEYIALLYSNKLSRGIYSIADAGPNATIGRIKKALNIAPLTLLNIIGKSNLVSYKNAVGDLDSTYAIKFTYKGISGIGDSNNGKSVPDAYRMVHPSHLGRVDIDTSSPSDPGMSGILCPFAKIYDGNRFSEAGEPDEWENEFNELMMSYKAITNLQEITIAEKKILKIDTPVRVQMAEESKQIIDGLINPIKMIINREGLDPEVEIPLEDSGRLVTSYEPIMENPNNDSELDG